MWHNDKNFVQVTKCTPFSILPYIFWGQYYLLVKDITSHRPRDFVWKLPPKYLIGCYAVPHLKYSLLFEGWLLPNSNGWMMSRSKTNSTHLFIQMYDSQKSGVIFHLKSKWTWESQFGCVFPCNLLMKCYWQASNI